MLLHDLLVQMAYFPTKGEEIESTTQGMPSPPPLGLNIDWCIIPVHFAHPMGIPQAALYYLASVMGLFLTYS